MKIKQSFFDACAEGNLERVKLYLPGLSEVDARSEEGWTGLIVACHGAHQDVAEWLITQGADVNATNHKGTTVFMYAKSSGLRFVDERFLNYLISQGADPNAKDSFGKTALDYVVDSHPGSSLFEYLSKLSANN